MGTTEDEMVGWHHRLDGHEFEQVIGVGDGQGGPACCGPWGRKELDAAEQLNSKPIGLPTPKVPEGSRSSDFLWVCTIPHPTKLELAIATVYYLSN